MSLMYHNMSSHEGSVSPGPEVGKHFVGWKLDTSFEYTIFSHRLNTIYIR